MKARGQPNSHGVECGKFWAAASEVPPDSLHLVPGIRDRRESKAPMDGLSLPPTCAHTSVKSGSKDLVGPGSPVTCLSHNSGSETGEGPWTPTPISPKSESQKAYPKVFPGLHECCPIKIQQRAGPFPAPRPLGPVLDSMGSQDASPTWHWPRPD